MARAEGGCKRFAQNTHISARKQGASLLIVILFSK
jgi:hypothetical protein